MMVEKTPDQIVLHRIETAYKKGESSLNLSGLGIDYLPSEIGLLTQLEVLHLSDNRLKLLPPEIGNLVNLYKLDLALNVLDSLPSEIGHLVNLRELNLFSNNLKTLPPEIGALTSITELNLVDNSFTKLPAEIGNLKKLTWLAPCGLCRLEELPDEIFNLENLEHLSLEGNRLTKISEKISRLRNLTDLDLSGNNLEYLPDSIGELSKLKNVNLSRNQLRDIPVTFFELQNLESLNLSSNKLETLPAEINLLKSLSSINLSNNEIPFIPLTFWDLKNLKSINLEANRIQFLPPEIGKLADLFYLNLFANQIESLPATIGNLVNLYELNLHRNQLTSLPKEFGNLQKLAWLDISNNQLVELPLEFSNLKRLSTLYIEHNHLDYPSELLNTFSPQQLVEYIRWLKDGKPKAVNEAKILIVGQGGVGKTSLVQLLILSEFAKNQAKTEGIAIKKWSIVNQNPKDRNNQPDIELNLWDFGGQEIMHATHQFFLTKRSLYLLVLDSRLTQEENRIEYWLKIIQSFGGESPVLIVGNKIDQHPLDIDRTGLQKKYPNIIGIIETSAATGAGIEELKTAITEQVNHLPHVRDLLPETWFTVKTKLEELGRETNFITHDKYLDLCTENEVSDETSQRTLIGFLHDLGVVLHFQDDPRLEALGILNPQWVTNGVYKILNSHTLFQNKGVLTVAMLDEILNLPEYPRGKRLFIVDMMKKFELCYDIDPDKSFLVPDLLPKDQPDLNFNGIPAFEYAYPVLPSSVITRFIVRMNQKIDDGFVWRTGVVLKIGENHALVKADIEDRKITIAIDGLEHTRRDALSAIRFQLDEIHASIKGLNPQKMVPIPNAPNAEPVKYEYLLKLERAGQPILLVEDGNNLVEVNIRIVLSGIENETQRKEQAANVVNIYGDVHTDGGDFSGRDKSISTGDRGVVVSGKVGGHLIAGDENQVIQDSYNKITSAEIDPELKQTMQLLIEAVAAMNKELPPEQAAEIEDDLGELVEEVTRPTPRQKWYSVSIEGLIKAAENLDKLGTPVISLSKKVLSLLTGGVVK